jgi:rod shape determining protein RodA
MLNKLFLYLKNLDWILFFAILLLLSFSLIEIYSIALGQETLDLLNFKKQIMFIIIGLSMMFFFAFLDYHLISNFTKYLYIFGLIMLLGVSIFGTTIRGTQGWIYLFGFGIQPVEFTKIILITTLAYFFSSKSLQIRPFKQLILSGAVSLSYVFLVLMQPDLGSSLILLSIWGFSLFVTGFNKKYFIIMGLILIIVFGASWGLFFKDYQKERVTTFLNPSANPLDEGYNISQAIIAVGAGKIMGRGVGFGSQSQLKFLPEAQNDFIFAVISEELGFLGSCLVLIFFIIIYYRLLVHLKKINNDFGIYFILFSMGLIFIEMFINIGMNIGLLPVIGISLPFLSYGGSVMLSHMILIGIIQSIIIRSKINY